MFEKHKAKVAEKLYEKELAEWQAQEDLLSANIKTTETFKGTDTNDVMLKPSEALFLEVANASLVGERRGPGHYEGKSSGVSIPIGHIGHSSVRYRVGATKGHFVQGSTYEAAVDVGTIFVTNKRVIFEGNKQTRECSFDKLSGINHNNQLGQTTFSVTNRQTPTTLHYGTGATPTFVFRLELALANFKNNVPQFLAGLKKQLAELEATKPTSPTK